MHNLRLFYQLLDRKRRRQLFLTLGAMLVGALAETITIGAALSFLMLLSGASGSALPSNVVALIHALGLDTMVVATIALIVAALLSAAFRLLLSWLMYTFIAAVGLDMATRVFSRTLRQPYSAFVQRNSSEVIAAVMKVQLLVSGLLLPALQAAISAVMVLVIAALLFIIDPLIAGIVGAAVGSAYVLAILATRGRLRGNSATMAETATLRTKIVQEGIGGIRDIILDQSQPVFERHFHVTEGRFRRAQVVTTFIASAPRDLVEAAGVIAIALAALAMSQQPGGIIEAIPVIGALALGAQRLLPLLQQVFRGVAHTLGNMGMLADVLGLMQLPIAPVLPRSAVPRGQALQQSIVFDRVGFEFPGTGFALRDIDLTIPQGSRIGIAGPTGGGKSTFLDLLMGLLDPGQGEIRIDGKPLDDTSRSVWQAQIAHVPQAIYLSDDSIAANIAFGVAEGEVDAARVAEAAKAACLARFLESLPEGLETRVGERGIRLSGGQRQRIGIARALYKGAQVLILDEATSALDDGTEAAVMESLFALGSDVTVIMVAHRTSTLARCDRILCIEDGRLS